MSPYPLIPREVLFGNPEKANPQLSPNGEWITYVAPYKGVLNIWIQPREGGEAKPVTFDTGRGIQSYRWAFDGAHLLYVQDNDGDENWNLYKVNVKQGVKPRPVTKLEKVQTRILATSRNVPNHIIIGLNNRNPAFHDPYKLNLKTGEMIRLFENEGALFYWFNDKLEPVLALHENEDGTRRILKKDPNAAGWSEFAQLGIAEGGMYLPDHLSSDGETLFWVDARGRDKGALMAIDLNTGSIKGAPLAQHNKADIIDVIYDQEGLKPLGAAYQYDKVTWIPLTPEMEKDLAYLEGAFPGAQLGFVSSDLRDRYWIVEVKRDQETTQYHLYDRSKQTTTLIFKVRPSLDEWPLQPMVPVEIPSRDGRTLMAYLTLPFESHSQDGVHPAHPHPMVVVVHGGPWGVRDVWGIDPTHQWLANRGYAVLSVNYRGSGGFGKDFFMASIGQWGRKMHEDILDGVAWACKEGVADPNKVAIMGGSYGGYETLLALTKSPDVFAAGVDIVGPSNLETFLNSIPPYWKPLLNYTIRLMGADHRTQEGRAYLKEVSPFYNADAIQAPLLIFQGATDPRVPQKESDQMVDAMRRHQTPVTYVVYDNEGHGFQRPENKLAYAAITEGFLKNVLGGRMEAVTNEIERSSAVLVDGQWHGNKRSEG